MYQSIAKLGIALGIIVITLAGCTSLPETSTAVSQSEEKTNAAPPPPEMHSALFEIDSSYLFVDTDPHSIFTLTEEQQQSFLYAFHHELEHLAPHHRFGEFLKRLTASYNYLERTLTAQQAFDGTAGNCMSLVVLTSALAELVELDIQYRQLTTNPLFDMQAGMILVSDHVRSRIYAPRTQGLGVLRPYITIDYFPTRTSRGGAVLEKSDLVAMFYTNRAAEMMLEEQMSAAALYTSLALSSAPTHGGSLNMAALLHARAGLLDKAEAFYRYGLEFEPENINLLNNYQVMLQRQSRDAEAQVIKEKIAALDNANPYQLIALAQHAMTQHEYRRAITFYDQALDIAPYLQQAYLQKAVALEALGHSERAASVLQEGLMQAQRAATDELFKRRISALKEDSRNAFYD